MRSSATSPQSPLSPAQHLSESTPTSFTWPHGGASTTRHQGKRLSPVAQSCPTLCNPMDCSPPGLPVNHQLPEPTQTHVHRVGDAIQPSHPLSSPSPAFNLSRIRVFSSESALHIRRPKHWSTRTWMQFINVLTRSPRTPALTTRPQISGSPRTLQPH